MTPSAAMTDDQARRHAQSEFDCPVAVEAGAGTGKTTVLVARILAWCLGRGWIEADKELADRDEITEEQIASRVLDGVVAITFTEAAAAQMATRVAAALANVAAKRADEVVGFFPDLLEPATSSDELAHRARGLIGSLDHLAVRTIHSHCWNLLATYPMAAGMSPDLRVDAEGRYLEEVTHEVVEEAVKQAYAGPDDHPLTRLALRQIDPRHVAAAIHELVSEGFNAEALKRDPLSAPARRAIRQRLLDAMSEAEEVGAILTTQKRDKTAVAVVDALHESLQMLEQTPAQLDLDGLAHLLDWLRETWTDGLVNRVRKWSAGGFGKTEDETLGEAKEALVRAATELSAVLGLYQRIDVEILDAGRLALQPLIAQVEDGLRARGMATYSALMTEAWRLLAEHPEVRRRERNRIRQLLVDEFQDTDRLQCELVRLLALTGKESQRPGLFVVGDPKQSIYGWRDADLEAYEGFVEELEAAGGRSVRLSRNFRSVPPVLAEVDRAIAPVMTVQAGLQPRFESLEPREDLRADPGFCRADRVAVEYWISWQLEGDEDTPLAAKTRADDAAQVEADAVARDISQLHHSEGVPWSEFGLLLRSTSRLEIYLEAFRKARVPFVVTSDKHYFRRREIIEAAALVRTIINPVDHLALVTLLRSATVGVPDAALLPFWRRGFPERVTRLQEPTGEVMESLRTLVSEVAADLPADIPGLESIQGWEASLVAALENLALLRQSFAVDPADRFIELLRQRFLFDVTEAARYLGLYRLANLDSFFRRLEQALEEQGGDIQAVLRALRRSVAEAEEAKEALPEGATEDAVQVMTIHGAKGLEFGHVYLVQLHAKGRKNDRPVVKADRRWVPGSDAEYVLFGSPTPGFDRVELRERQVESTEQVRTLYVAMTRAKQRLVMIGGWPELPSPVEAQKRVTYIDLLRSREPLPGSIADLLDACQEQKRSWVDVADARWRFPALETPTEASPATEGADSKLPPVKEIEKQAETLDKHRHNAKLRMERPYSGTASSETGHRLARLLADELRAAGEPADRGIARLVGEAFHRMLETWDLTAPAAVELERQQEIHTEWLSANLSAERLETALERFELLLDRFRAGKLLQHFVQLAEHVVARELPVVLPPVSTDEGPVGFVTGSVDLLYHDPDTERFVVVDYKTDRVEDEPELAKRAAVYQEQEAIYARAIQESLHLDELPACQLWFIWPDRLWDNPPAKS